MRALVGRPSGGPTACLGYGAVRLAAWSSAVEGPPLAQRLDTRLSRLLLDEHALSVEALEEAVQHQVVHGGALDTILLETGVLDEDRVTGALCLAWQTPPVSREELTSPTADAVARLPRRMAQTMGICPFRLGEDGLHVLVAAPVDTDLLAEVSSLVGTALVPYVVPEVRLQQALQAAYGVPLQERMVSLLHVLDHGALPTPPSTAQRAHDVSNEGTAFERLAREWTLRDALSQLAEQPDREGISRVALAYARRFLPFGAVFGVRDGRAVGWSRSGHAEGAQFEHRPLEIPAGSWLEQALSSPSPLLGKPPLHDGNTAFLGWLGRRRPQTALLIPVAVAGRTVAALYADGGVRRKEPAALADLVAFGARIGPSFERLLRARHRAHADLFERGALDASHGSDEHEEDVPAPPPLEEPMPRAPALERSANGASIDGTSPFALRYAREKLDARLSTGDEGSDDDDVPAPPSLPEEAEAEGATDGVEEPVAEAFTASDAEQAVAPVASPEGDGDAPSGDAESDDAETQTPESALEDEAPEEVPVLTSEDDWEDVVLDPANARQLTPEATPPAKESARVEAPRAAPERLESPERLVEHLESLLPRVVEEAKEQLIALGEEALPALKAAFPGRLLLDPIAAKHPPDSAKELGPLIEVVAALGRPALEAAIPHLDAPNPAHRFAATFLFNLAPDERAIELLRPRLHDAEPRIRRVAAAALSHFVAHEGFGAVLTHLRARLTSAAPEARQRAVWFLGYFRDVGSVPQLIALLDDTPEVARSARGALKQITLQDLGPLAKAWDRWWRRAKKKTRIDWLIEGLRSRDRDLRYIASIELTRLAGESFGYRCDDPKRERDQAIKGFESWWETKQAKLRVGA